MNEEANLPLPDRDRPLDEVIEDFARRVCPGGPYGDIDEWSVYDESFRRLVTWAGETGRFFEGLRPLKEGGREHDLSHDPLTGTWLKFTKPSAAGYVISFTSGTPALEPGLPLEYLERLALQNEIFEDQMTFVGIAGERYRPTMVTRQPDIPGDHARPSEIIHLMTTELGFSILPPCFSVGYANSLAFIRDDVAVFDLRPANVVRTAEGIIVPIDSIPVRLDEWARRILGT